MAPSMHGPYTLNSIPMSIINMFHDHRSPGLVFRFLEFDPVYTWSQVEQPMIFLILKILHDLSILQSHNSQGIRYLGSCRIFSIHRTDSLAVKERKLSCHGTDTVIIDYIPTFWQLILSSLTATHFEGTSEVASQLSAQSDRGCCSKTRFRI